MRTRNKPPKRRPGAHDSPVPTDNPLYGFPATLISLACDVHIRTVRRWVRTGTTPRAAVRLVQLMHGGDLGVLNRAWAGWKLAADGALYSPHSNKFGYHPGYLLGTVYAREHARALEHEVIRQRAEIAALKAAAAAAALTRPTHDGELLARLKTLIDHDARARALPAADPGGAGQLVEQSDTQAARGLESGGNGSVSAERGAGQWWRTGHRPRRKQAVVDAERAALARERAADAETNLVLDSYRLPILLRAHPAPEPIERRQNQRRENSGDNLRLDSDE